MFVDHSAFFSRVIYTYNSLYKMFRILFGLCHFYIVSGRVTSIMAQLVTSSIPSLSMSLIRQTANMYVMARPK